MNLTNLLNFDKSSVPSVICDPFTKNGISEIFISYNIGFSYGPSWYAVVKFKNGNTTGEQRTDKYKTFEEVVAAIKSIGDSLK